MSVPGFHSMSYAQEVIFAPGALEQTGKAVQQAGWQRLMLCCGASQSSNGQVDRLKANLGNCLVAVFDRVLPHVQDGQVEETLALALDNAIDAVIGMGGGSAVGMAKAVAASITEKRNADHAPVPVIAIPTSYAGSEMTAVYGVTHSRETPPRKVTVSNPRIAPRLVIYDPELTLSLPAEITASTGMNALAHTIEALYSTTRHPLSTAAALRAIESIAPSLPRCFAHGGDLDARTEMLLGAYLAGYSLAGVSMGLHHGLCHVLGGSFQVPHGVANAIILPHAVRFNASVAMRQLLPAAQAMGIAIDASRPEQAIEEMAQKIYALVGEMHLPQRLRDVGIPAADLALIARLAFENRTVQSNLRPIESVVQLEQLLQDVW